MKSTVLIVCCFLLGCEKMNSAQARTKAAALTTQAENAAQATEKTLQSARNLLDEMNEGIKVFGTRNDPESQAKLKELLSQKEALLSEISGIVGHSRAEQGVWKREIDDLKVRARQGEQ